MSHDLLLNRKKCGFTIVSLGDPSCLGGPVSPVELKTLWRDIWYKFRDNILYRGGDIRVGFWEASDSKIIPPRPVFQFIDPGEGQVQLFLNSLEVGSVLVGS